MSEGVVVMVVCDRFSRVDLGKRSGRVGGVGSLVVLLRGVVLENVKKAESTEMPSEVSRITERQAES